MTKDVQNRDDGEPIIIGCHLEDLLKSQWIEVRIEQVPKKENLNLNEKLSISLVIRFAKTGL